MGSQKVGVIKQFGNAQQGKLASQQFTHSGLRHVKEFFELPWSKSFPLDNFEDVLMQAGLEFKL